MNNDQEKADLFSKLKSGCTAVFNGEGKGRKLAVELGSALVVSAVLVSGLSAVKDDVQAIEGNPVSFPPAAEAQAAEQNTDPDGLLDKYVDNDSGLGM